MLKEKNYNFFNKGIGINRLFVVFFLVVSILSIMFMSELFYEYRLQTISFLSYHYPVMNKIFKFVRVKQILELLWVINLALLILWIFYNKKRPNNTETDYQNIANLLKDQEKSSKLLGYMISKAWGEVLWSGDLFAKIFKFPEQSHGQNFLDILKIQENFYITEEQLLEINKNFRHKQSYHIDLTLKVASDDGVLRLNYMYTGKFYIWQVMLVKKVINHDDTFLLDNFINLNIPVMLLNSLGKLIYANNEFLKLFALPENIDFEDVEISDLIEEKPLSSDHEFSWLPHNSIITKIICKTIDDKVFEAILLQQNVYKKNSTNIAYIRNIIVPIYSFIPKKVISNFDNIIESESNIVIENNSAVSTNIITSEIATAISSIEDIWEKIPLAIIIINSNNEIIKVNANAFKLLNIGVELLQQPIQKLFSNNYKYEQFIKAINDNESIYTELYNSNNLFSFIGGQYDEDHKIIYVSDASKIKELKADVKLYQGLQAIGQLASSVAHDFNNLLTAIVSFNYFAQESQEEDSPVRLELEHIKQNAQRAKIMIRQLLTFSRKQELQPEVFDVNSEISDLMSTVIRLVGDRITSNFKRGKNIGSIFMDKVQFHQVMTNLVVNAKDAMKNGGLIEVSTKVVKIKEHKSTVLGFIPSGEYVVIEIKDQGEGIKKDNYKSIFQAQFSTKGEKGNGLGLYTVNKIINDIAGFIDLKSTPNKGTSFYLYIPKHSDSKQALNSENIEQSGAVKTIENVDTKENTVEKQDVKEEQELLQISLLDLTGSETVLLVEDEIPVRMVCSRLLKSKGYDVIEAENGDDALEIIANLTTKNIDLIVSDVMMPGISGPELVSKVRDIIPNIKAILMSGYAEDILDDIGSDSEIKNIEFLSKPFTPDIFATKVKNILKG